MTETSRKAAVPTEATTDPLMRNPRGHRHEHRKAKGEDQDGDNCDKPLSQLPS